MRSLATLLIPLLTAAPLAAQQALFFRLDDLAPVPPLHSSAADAVRHLLAGPTPAEAAAGFTSRVPAGTTLVADHRQGSRVTLVFDETLLQTPAGTSFEDAVEQIDKTALGEPGVTAVRILVRRSDGREVDLRTARGEGAPVALPLQPPTPIVSLTLPFGTLSGKRIAISPGHGYYWHSTLGWTTQRGLIDGLIEDIHTAEIANQYLIPFLQNLGAEVVFCREHGERPVDALLDNDQGAPAYVETGSWTTSASSGYGGGGYRFVATNPSVETATATWHLPVVLDGLYPVYVWYRASSNRTTAATYRIHHQGGVSTAVVDQTVDNLTWAHLGDFWFTAAAGAQIELSNLSAASGVCIADTVRLGGGMGSIVRGTGPSGQARWRECARYWSQFSGAPSTVWDSISTGNDNDDDVTARPRFAEWRTADAFVSLHTNAGGGSGTSTYIYDGGATPGSTTLSQTVHTQIVSDLQAYWNASWTDRGQLQANFGEVRLLSTMPGILVELAFHDTPGSLDHGSLHDPDFRYLAARAMARGVLRYFAPLAPFPPEPPTALRVTQDGSGGLRVAFDAAAGATQYTIEQSLDGKGFAEVATVTTTNWSTGPLPPHSTRSFRVRANNSSGRSFPTEVLTAGTDHLGQAQALLVQGFDRLDRYVKGPQNTRDYLPRLADALRRDAAFSLGFDAASNEAVALGRVLLGGYGAVVWSLGEESTGDETFSSIEQALVSSYLAGGGSLLVSGAEVGWDLDAMGSAADRSFYRNTLGATWVADDANTYTLQAGINGTVSAGLAAGIFDNGSGPTYDVDYPDVLAPTNGNGTVCLRYGNGLAAGVQMVDPISAARVVTFGLPLETMLDADQRARLLQQSLAFLLTPMMVQGPRSLLMGVPTPLPITLPSEAGMPYIFAMSESNWPGVVLPLGHLFPLNPGLFLDLSLTPGSPFFVDFVGTLDSQGRATPVLTVPPFALLDGWSFYFAGLTTSPVLPIERQVTNWIRVTFVL
ncbi:MAG: N-acetylmuramoyl-L-alanine amidase [Planctomycetes bacterium]|nr:N-acetylmuramoyl-L-alanine amidase [Planctomycetota bacterium]